MQAQTPKNRFYRSPPPGGRPGRVDRRPGCETLGSLPSSITSEGFRKTLQRARAKFLELLIQELRDTISPATKEDVEAEIYDLGLGSFYRKYAASTENDED
ncbi:MAG: hypothetical protein U0800_27325 [Isosphaeraceae bacterium]